MLACYHANAVVCVRKLGGHSGLQRLGQALWIIVLIASSAPAVALERLVMPFTCAVEQNRLIVEPSTERTYLILGERSNLPFTACAATGTERCRTFMVHRFEIACKGGRVSWLEVAARIPAAFAERIWIHNGRLNVQLKPRKASAADAGCAGPSARLLDTAGPSHVLPAPDRRCVPAQRPTPTQESVALPAGYAPLAELGARLVMPGGMAPAATINAAAEQASFQIAASRVSDRIVVSETLPPIETGTVTPVVAAADVRASDWTTSVISADNGADEPDSYDFAAWLTATLLLSAGAWVSWSRGLASAAVRRGRASGTDWRQKLAQTASRMRFSRSEPDFADESIANAADAVEALLTQCTKAVDALSVAGPLQDVLRQELRTLNQRLQAIKASASEGNEAGRRAGPLFRVMIREIERIRRIADGAAQSLGAASRDVTTIPQTRSEAYEVLGVNASVSDSILKKIVDALRMSWHPDLASDEADRQLREARIKQINIAWELVNEKRRSA